MNRLALGLVRIFQGFRPENGSADGTDRMHREPHVRAFRMEAVVAAGDQPNGLLPLDLVQADRALGPGRLQLPPQHARQPAELLRRQPRLPGLLAQLHRWRQAAGDGEPEDAEIDDNDGRHARAGDEQDQEDGENHRCCSTRRDGTVLTIPARDRSSRGFMADDLV